MVVATRHIELDTRKEGEIVDITGEVADAVRSTKLSNGTVTVFVQGSTGAVTTMEYEPGLIQDLRAALERVAPRDASYEHERRWHDGNGHSHVRASIVGPSVTIPFVDGKLVLGTWQQVVFVELDVRGRSRKLIVQAVGE
ncbi:MAG: YjbQ family protein [Candidatus Brockarchaeota archaeon]|nr:YjbQ family protein [Candidatus Brockarchaeota archaeon]